MQTWLAWLAAFLVSLFLANIGTAWLWNRAIRFSPSSGNSILGPMWDRGVVVLSKPMRVVDGRNDVLQISLVEYWYRGPELSLFGQFDNVVLSSGSEQRTDQILMAVDEEFHYVHHFQRIDPTPGASQGMGVAVGTFSLDNGRRPERYAGSVTYLVPAETRHEKGQKLEDKQVLAWRERFGVNWRQMVLHDPQIVATLVTIHGLAYRSCQLGNNATAAARTCTPADKCLKRLPFNYQVIA